MNINGRLELSEQQDYAYILKDGDIEYNLSEALDRLQGAYVYITVDINGRTALSLIDGEKLNKTPDGDNITSWFLQGQNVYKFLFNHVGDYMSVTIRSDGDR